MGVIFILLSSNLFIICLFLILNNSWSYGGEEFALINVSIYVLN